MALIKGVIDFISDKPGKFGPQCSIKINDIWYDNGKTKGGLQQGDFVEFSATKNERGYWKVDKGTIRAAEAPEGASKPVGAGADAKQRVTGSGQTYSNDGRQDSIVMQSSRKDALVFLELLLSQSLIDMGKSKNLADKQAILEAYLDKYTEHFVKEIKQGKTDPMQEETGSSVDPTKGKPRPLGENDPGDDLNGVFE